ncbi:hydrolase CocE/NonD family protein [Pseudonocardia dioxanivorans CB1190]|uniref:Hydrolase CocE/NonD family protein n=1 Tax=Pseudonocardia dioxanivorans (strain ATCC 55486 / DSM 44775 / JCM 13855 / CB1190) TaxID=675635 RepID=F4CY36_PSEUX|nr:CocE/NonD family hydrolase [Pseudonocardia dioxanivorans]AEA24277.1 hydrolase CocE/NonD family protein [Pseudonocardia dioxanivorans CB1190]
MTTTVATEPVAERPGRGMQLADRVLDRVWRLPSGGRYTVTRGLRAPMRDGVELIGDLYTPADVEPLCTILVRGPYGRTTLNSLAFARVYAARGWQVLLQSVRGTFGSGGAFDPMRREIEDGQDTVAWMRGQPWFDGTFATLGLSYLGFTQWALLMDPPPELAASVVVVGPHDFNLSAHGIGSFSLADFLGWSDMVAHQEEGTLLRRLVRERSAARRQQSAMDGIPLVASGEALLAGKAPWYRDWASRPEPSDPFWRPMQLSAALDRVRTPVLLVGGWQDLFIRQTLQQWTHLHGRGLDVALTVGPWTHADAAARGGGRVVKEALDFLGSRVAGRPATRPTPVRVYVTGADPGWRGSTDWPPPTTPRSLYVEPGRGLAAAASGRPAAPVTFTYDPADPTPALGGPLLDPKASGVVDNGPLEARADVVTFTGEALTETVEVAGTIVVELAHRSDNPHADLFVRICDVDERGRSFNVTDGFARLTDADREQVVRVELAGTAHRFGPGHRIRLQVSGGAHPRLARNLGSGEPAATGSTLRPSARTLPVDGRSRVLLPVVG